MLSRAARLVACLAVLIALSTVVTASARRPGTAVTVVVGTATTGRVGAGFVGFSFEKDRVGAGMFDPGNRPLVALFRLLGPSVLRVGGNLVDLVSWNPGGRGGSPAEVAPDDVTRLAGFLRATGWTALYGINLKTNTVPEAVAEARFAARALGSSLLAFEIGNEPDAYLTQRAYQESFEAYTAAIRAAVPGARFDGPGTLAEDWLPGFAAREGPRGLDLLAMHAYVGGHRAASIPRLVVSGALSPRFDAFEGALRAAASADRIPSWRMTETNSFVQGGVPGVSDVQAAALWSLDLMHGVAAHGGDGVNFHGGTSTQFPLVYSPIAFAGIRPTGVRAVFYGGLLWTLAGTGPLRPAAVSGPPLVSAWGIGGNVILNNKNPWPVTVTVRLAVPAAAAEEYLLTAGSLSSTAITLAGSTVDEQARFTPSPRPLAVSGNGLVVDLPAASAALVRTRTH
jgi:hypothetical protein